MTEVDRWETDRSLLRDVDDDSLSLAVSSANIEGGETSILTLSRDGDCERGGVDKAAWDKNDAEIGMGRG